MTDSKMALLELLEKSGDEGFLRDMVQWLTHRLMEADVEQRCGAGPYERSKQRENYRNGTRSRQWDTRSGTVDLEVPRLRHGNYLPAFLEPRRVVEKALTAVVQEAYVQRISTRSVDELVKAAKIEGISSSQVSRLTNETDERVQTFLNRPIEGGWPYVWLDAT